MPLSEGVIVLSNDNPVAAAVGAWEWVSVIRLATMQVIQLIEGGEGYGVATVLRMILRIFPEASVVAMNKGAFVQELPTARLRWCGKVVRRPRRTSTAGILLQLVGWASTWWRASKHIADALGPETVILHCHNQVTALIAAMVRFRRKGRTTYIILHYHSKMSRRLWGLIRFAQVQLLGRCVDVIVCVSKAVSLYWQGAACDLKTIHNAIEPLANARLTPDAKQQDGRNAMLIAASLSAEKGHLVAVEALRLLKAMGVDLQLWIAGGSLDQSQNPFVSVLRERIVAAGLADSVLLLGEVTMVRELARRAWVGLQLRSTPEPFGLWSLEAMEAGLPLVATNTGGTPELVRDGIDGLLIPPGRPDAIAAAVLRLHRDPLLRQKLSENARLRAKAFSVDAFKHKLSALYSELAS